jgi:hypothetical protein
MPVFREQKAPKVFRELPENKACKAYKVIRALMAIRGQKVHREFKAK